MRSIEPPQKRANCPNESPRLRLRVHGPVPHLLARTSLGATACVRAFPPVCFRSGRCWLAQCRPIGRSVVPFLLPALLAPAPPAADS